MKKIVVGLTGLLAVLASAPLAARAESPPEEARFGELVNGLRSRHGLPTLEVRPELTAKARRWARTMADEGRIWHSDLADGITADWAALSENVGMGGSVERLHDAFVNSPRHYDNLVRPDFEYAGFGVVNANGTLFVAEVFMTLRPQPPAPLPAVAPAPASAPIAAAVPASPPPRPAAPKPAAPAPTLSPNTSPADTTTTTRPAGPTPAEIPAPASPPVATPAPVVSLTASPVSATSPVIRTGAAGLGLLILITVAGGLIVVLRPAKIGTSLSARLGLAQA